MSLKKNVLFLLGLFFAFSCLEYLKYPPELLVHVPSASIVLGIVFGLYLAKIFVSILKSDQRPIITDSLQNFELKVVTSIATTPDEIAVALTDETLRLLWDPNVTRMVKQNA